MGEVYHAEDSQFHCAHRQSRCDLVSDMQLSKRDGRSRRPGGFSVFIVLFFILLVFWVLGFAAFHIAGGFIHLLLLLAVISIILHFFRGRRAV